jgi:hypothetical protein
MLRRRGRPPARYDDGERGGARVRVSSRAAQEAEPVSPFRAFSSLANFPGPNFFGWVSDPVGGRTGTVVGAWKGRKLSVRTRVRSLAQLVAYLQRLLHI